MAEVLDKLRLRILLAGLMAGGSWMGADAQTTADINLLVINSSGKNAGPNASNVEVISQQGKSMKTLNLRCDRMHYAHGVIGCLQSVPGRGAKFDLADKEGRPGLSLNFPNILLASRVRIAADATMAAITGFSSGHSYSGTDFSTRTYLVDVSKKRLLADVSTFRVIENEQLKLAAKRFNVWGVSFDPLNSNRFVVTIGAGNQVYLAEGDVKAKTLSLLRTGVECPSFSPDGKRIAFKRRNGSGGWWPAVYEFAGGRETVMAGSASVDDQIEWLDNQNLIYEMGREEKSAGTPGIDLVTRKADGSGVAKVVKMDAASPARWN